MWINSAYLNNLTIVFNPNHFAVLIKVCNRVWPFLQDTLNNIIGHNTFNLSTNDKFCVPYTTMAMHFSLKEDNLSMITPKLVSLIVSII